MKANHVDQQDKQQTAEKLHFKYGMKIVILKDNVTRKMGTVYLR
jgi:hypothetical protein